MKNINFLNELFEPKTNQNKKQQTDKNTSVDFYTLFAEDDKQIKMDKYLNLNDLVEEKQNNIQRQTNIFYKMERGLNPKQIEYIERRRERREYLRQFMVQNSAKYTHESRHKHAMSRMRAPSGRFLTKKETEKVLQQQKILKDDE